MQAQSSTRESAIILSGWLLTLLIMCVLAISTRSNGPLQAVRDVWFGGSRNWFWAFSLLPIPLLAVLDTEKRRQMAILAFCILVALVYVSAAVFHVSSRDATYVALKTCAVLGLVILAVNARSVRGAEHFLICLMFTTYLAMDAFSLNGTYAIRPQTLDEFTYAFDAGLSFNPAWNLFHDFVTHHPFAALCNVLYESIMAAPFLLYVVQTRHRDDRVVPALRAFLIAAILGMACYLLFPVSGPWFFFGPNAYAAHPIAAEAPRALTFYDTWRNGMPSLRLAFALLAAINVPSRLRLARLCFFVFAIATTVAALANGQHYFVDMVAALPFVCAVQALSLYFSYPANFSLLRRFGVSVAAFSAFLLLLLYIPEWARKPEYTWGIVLLITIYTAHELRALRRVEPTGSAAGSSDGALRAEALLDVPAATPSVSLASLSEDSVR